MLEEDNARQQRELQMDEASRFPHVLPLSSPHMDVCSASWDDVYGEQKLFSSLHAGVHS